MPEHDAPNPASLERALRDRIRADEQAAGPSDRPPDTLWGHLLRVAAIAERLGREEGIDPALCRLAGLFHDAGKFAGGRYHHGDVPEETLSVDALRDLGAAHAIPADDLDAVAEAIEQLYRDDPDPSPLAAVLFDADNLDKLGPLGVANHFVKRGLRGRGIGRGALLRASIELTYARVAPRSLWSAAGRRVAAVRGPQTRAFFHDLLEQLRDQGIADFHVQQVPHGGLVLELVTPGACACGAPMQRTISETPGMKCSEIRVTYTCAACAAEERVRFCRPRLVAVQ
jgi:hypothetical protein